jgi:hypothetical protein
VTIAIASAVAALLGVALGQVLSGRNDHSKWLREQRFAACHDFLSGIEGLTSGPSDSPDDRERAFTAIAKMKLVCPWSVEERAHDVFSAALHLAGKVDATETQQLDFEELLVAYTNEARMMLGTHRRRRDRARHT